MRDVVPDRLEKGRVNETDPRWMTKRGDWYGRFIVKAPSGAYLLLMVSAGEPNVWKSCGFPPPAFEHVSVSVRNGAGAADRCPTWEEMAFVKDLCWGPEECVLQYHPPRSEYVNYHPFVLHLWKPIGVDVPRPPAQTVGPKAATEDHGRAP